MHIDKSSCLVHMDAGSGRSIEELKICVIKTVWNPEIVDSLTNGCVDRLKLVGVSTIGMKVVSGSYELPLAAQSALNSGEFNAVICIGALIKGQTDHYKYICEAVTQGIMNVGLKYGKPVIFGVLMCHTDEHARARAGLGGINSHNHGIDWADAAVLQYLNYAHTPNTIM